MNNNVVSLNDRRDKRAAEIAAAKRRHPAFLARQTRILGKAQA